MRSVVIEGSAPELVAASGGMFPHVKSLRQAKIPSWVEKYVPADTESDSGVSYDAASRIDWESSDFERSRLVLTADDVTAGSGAWGPLLVHHDRKSGVWERLPGSPAAPGSVVGLSDAELDALSTPVCGVCNTRRSRHHYLFAGGTPDFPDPMWVGASCLEREDERFSSHVMTQLFISPERLAQQSQGLLQSVEWVPVGVILAAVLWSRDMHADPRWNVSDVRFAIESEIMAYAINGSLRPEIEELLLTAEVERARLLAMTPETVMERKLWDVLRGSTAPNVKPVVGLLMQSPRVLERLAVRELTRELSFPPSDAPSLAHVGVMGERFRDLEVMVTRSQLLPTGLGLVVFQDIQGNKLTWFTGSRLPEVGEHGALTATVKRHDWFRGSADTRVNRCAFARF